jgi:16S rRNA (cytosine1402-N4)-methyltransferase
MTQQYQHQSVLLQEAVEALVTDRQGCYVDGTFGRGGHSRLILQQLAPEGRLLVMDKDPEAVAVAKSLQAQDPRVALWHGSFSELPAALAQNAMSAVQGVLLDLGVSSPQLDDPLRGFSFNKEGPLDMRMDTSKGMTAAQWLQQAPEEEIARVIYEYGEEKFSRRMARAVVAARQKDRLTSTLQLAEIIKAANPAWEKHKHPATRAFQGIRIFINGELDDLEQVLPAMLEGLAVGGRMVVISFHSLEDRMVKQFIRKQEKGDDYPPGLPITQDMLKPRLRSVGKPLKGGTEDKQDNVRARSAVMRVAEKIA